MQNYQFFGFSLTPAQLAVVAFTSFLAGFSKSGVIGLGIVVTPLMASVFPAGVSLGFMVLLYIVGDLTAFARPGFRREVMWRPLLKALPWGVFGTSIGWWIAGSLGDAYGPEADRYLRKVIGALMASVVCLSWYVGRHPEIAMPSKSASNRDRPAGKGGVKTWYATFFGCFAGMVSMLTNSAGPIWAMYFSSLGLEVREVIGASIWCFFIVALAKIPLSANLGFLDWNTVKFNLLLAPLTVAGVLVGYRISDRFSKKTFARVVQTLATVGSIYMLFFS